MARSVHSLVFVVVYVRKYLSLSCHNVSRASRAYVIHCHRDSKNNVTTVECETVNWKYMAGKFIRYYGFCHITIQIENWG